MRYSFGHMRIDSSTHLLEGARRVDSPNCDARPASVAIDLLVVHGISLPPGEFGGPHIEALFTNTLDVAAHPYFQQICGLKVSSHVLIRRDGELIQFVPFNQRAWHAGESCFEDRQRCNDFSIGVELEGCDDQAYTDVQYQRLAELASILIQTYPGLTAARITGHSDVSPGRKTDPGPTFDWSRFHQLLEAADE